MDFSKPRVAIYYDVLPQTHWRNDGAPFFMHWNLQKLLNGKSAQELMKSGLQDDGNVVHLSPINPKQMYGEFDLHVLVDYGEDALGIPLEWEIPHPNVYWAFDTHIDEKGYQYRLNRARQFDHVYLCHKPYVSRFIADGIPADKISYLPVAAEVDCHHPYPVMPKWDWSFIGHFNSQHRIDLIDRFIKEFGLGDGKGYLGYRIPQIQGHCVMDDMAKKFSMSRLTIHASIKQDLAMRVFEAMGSGTVVLADDIEPIHDHFIDGKHLVLYKNFDEAIAKANFLLKDDAYRREIIKNGVAEIQAHHTYRHRTLEILKTCLNYEPKGELLPC